MAVAVEVAVAAAVIVVAQTVNKALNAQLEIVHFCIWYPHQPKNRKNSCFALH